MGKGKSVFVLARNLFCSEWANKRTVMGFLLGMALPGYWLSNYMNYVKDCGEPVNVLEAFIVIAQLPGSLVLVMLGWLLIVSGAPFVNGNTYYSLCRGGRRAWNGASFLYLLVQSVIYLAFMALPMVLFSLPVGFAGKMWSSPVYMLAKDVQFVIESKYHILFPQIGMMQGMNVVQAFFATTLCLMLYLLILGELLYTFSLLLGGIWGVVCTFLVHISGCFMGKGGLSYYAVAANHVDGGGLEVKPVAVMLAVLGVCVLLQNLLIKTVDFKGRPQEE